MNCSGLSNQSSQEKSGVQIPILNISQITQIPVAQPVTFRVKKGFEKDTDPQWVYSDALGLSRIRIKEIERIQIYLTDEDDENSTVPLLTPGTFSGYLVVNEQLKPLPVGSGLDTYRGIFYWQPGPGFIGEYRFVFIEKIQDQYVSCKKIVVNIVPGSE